MALVSSRRLGLLIICLAATLLFSVGSARGATGPYSVSGSLGASPSVVGTIMTLDEAPGVTAVADSLGNFTLTGLASGSYTLRPKNLDANFSPTAKGVTVANQSVTGVAFSSTPAAPVFFFDDFSGSSLSSAWEVISRHGEYSQSETECNVPGLVQVTNGALNITTVARPTVCGDFNLDGSARHQPSTWPYATGDVQWTNLSFTYGRVTVRARFPARETTLWPAIWLLGSNCQQSNPLSADTPFGGCPSLNSPSYAEIDMVECDLNNWCQLALANLTNSGSGGQGFPTCGFPVDGNWHVFTLDWTPRGVFVGVDGRDSGCSFQSPAWTIPSTPLFLILQTQTGGVGGTPFDTLLPATLQVDFVRVTQPGAVSVGVPPWVHWLLAFGLLVAGARMIWPFDVGMPLSASRCSRSSGRRPRLSLATAGLGGLGRRRFSRGDSAEL